MKMIEWVENKKIKNFKKKIFGFDEKSIKTVLQFHQSLPNYEKTPLIDLKELAKYCGVKKIWVKDESKRFGLNAFKVLGGSYSIGKCLSEILNEDISKFPFSVLTSKEIKKKLGDLTFITATDGNHGRGVAWMVKHLQQKSVVYMPKGSSLIRLENIRKEGADASITDMNYDDAVRLAAKYAEEHNGVVVQDTAWDGYEEIPAWIMQGYGTMGLEALEQLRNDYKVERPTHIFLQAGVGSLAGGIQGFFASVFGEDCPTTVVVEAKEAACYYESAIANDGKPRAVGGDMPTIMAGLACGEVNITGFEVLKNHSKVFVSAPNYVAANGMRVLGNPLNGDKKVVSGESGAVTLGLVYELMTNPEYKDLKESIGLDENSRVLLFSTEGDTDPDKYREIVWEGSYNR